MDEVSNQFHKLYFNVDVAERKGDRGNQEVIQCYFWFGKALSDRLAVLLKSNPPQTAHTKLNKEVKEKLLGNTKDAMVHKRTEKFMIFSVKLVKIKLSGSNLLLHPVFQI